MTRSFRITLLVVASAGTPGCGPDWDSLVRKGAASVLSEADASADAFESTPESALPKDDAATAARQTPSAEAALAPTQQEEDAAVTSLVRGRDAGPSADGGADLDAGNGLDPIESAR